jgi:hypothetical protein
MTRPSIFIVGAPKCGTTALYSYLKAHPDVFMSSLKEPQFFGEDLLGNRRNICDWESYLALFAAAKSQRAGEASTVYLGSPSAARRIKDFSPAAQILIMLRNPLEVMQAEHGVRILGGNEMIVDFESALAADEQDEPCATPRHRRPWGMRYRELVRFAPQVTRYFRTFGSERVHVIVYDDFKEDTAKAYGETLGFLGLRAGFEPRLRPVNRYRRIRSMPLHRTLLAPPAAIRAVSHAVMSQPMRRFVGNCIRRLNESVEPRPPLAEAASQQLLAKLKREIAPDVDALSRLLNRDLSHWYS